MVYLHCLNAEMDTFAEKLHLRSLVCFQIPHWLRLMFLFYLQEDQILRKVDQRQWEESMSLYDQKATIGVFLERNKMEKMKTEGGD